MSAQPTIVIVDDDPGIRESLEGLQRSVGLQVKALALVPEFLKEERPEDPLAWSSMSGCLAEAVSTLNGISPRRTFTFRSFLSPGMETSRCRSRR